MPPAAAEEESRATEMEDMNAKAAGLRRVGERERVSRFWRPASEGEKEGREREKLTG